MLGGIVVPYTDYGLNPSLAGNTSPIGASQPRIRQTKNCLNPSLAGNTSPIL